MECPRSRVSCQADSEKAIEPVPLATVAAALRFSGRPAWGMALRPGHLAIDEHDFKVITQAMQHRLTRKPRSR